jgi:YqjK-like protein
MNKKLTKLAKRRERLILDSTMQRAQLVQIADTWREPLALADKGLLAMSFVRKHPIIMVGVSAILLKMLGPSRVGKWFSEGLIVWQFMRKLQSKFLAPVSD